MIKNTNSKMTTNSQLSTTKPKTKDKDKDKVSKQVEQEQNHRNGDHIEGYQWEGWEENGGKLTGNKKHKWQVENRQGEVKKSIGNGEAKKLICMTREHELMWENAGQGEVQGRGE